MTKAMRMMKDEMSRVESVVYVLDARAPLSCINPAFDEIIGSRTRLYVLNKCDTVPIEELNKWKAFFESKGKKCIIANSTVKGGAQKLVGALKELNEPIISRYKAKGVKKTIRAMVIGVPNCGKSTLINSVLGKSRTVTGNRPGVTRGKQWVSIDPYLDLLDTPGTLYPDFSDQTKATRLAIIGSIKDDILDITELSTEILTFLMNNYPDELKTRYKLEKIPEDKSSLLELIGKKRGFVLKGGEIDIDRTSQAIVTDFRKQAFGKLILEKYDERSR